MMNEDRVRADLVGHLIQEGVTLAFQRMEADDNMTETSWLEYHGSRRGDPLKAIAQLRLTCEEALEEKKVLDDANKRVRFEVAYGAFSAIENMFSA